MKSRTLPIALARKWTLSISHVPAACEPAALDAFCRSVCDGASSVALIAERVQARFPAAFANVTAARTRVADLVERYAAKVSKALHAPDCPEVET